MSAEITLREVYDAVQELRHSLASAPATLTDHETRLRSLERKIWWASGFAAVGGAGLWSQFGTAMGAG